MILISDLKNSINIVTPGRVCLFGDHQDYLGLPIIAAAINRFIYFSSEENTDGYFHIRMPDIGEERMIAISESFDSLLKNDHLGSVLRVVRRYGCIPKNGYDIEIKSTIPINAGVSSSSAVVVSWTHFLLETFGSDQKITPQFVAQLAYEAEVLEHQSPGGKMDQYTIALGNIIYLETGAALSFRAIGKQLYGLVLGVSGIPKQTLGVLGNLREKAQEAISEVKRKEPQFDLKKTRPQETKRFLPLITTSLRPYFLAAIENHDITLRALKAFETQPLDTKIIGQLMTEHHGVLKDRLHITVPLIDSMIDAALGAGAYGAKIVGSGGGGSIIALVPKKQIVAVIKAIKDSGATNAFEVEVVGGSRVIRS